MRHSKDFIKKMICDDPNYCTTCNTPVKKLSVEDYEEIFDDLKKAMQFEKYIKDMCLICGKIIYLPKLKSGIVTQQLYCSPVCYHKGMIKEA